MSHVVYVVLPHWMEKDGEETSQGSNHHNTVSWKTASLWEAMCALGAADLLPYVLPCSAWAAFMALLCLHFLFLFEFQEQEHVHSCCQWLCLAQPSLKYPYAVSSLDRFFSISLNVHINVPYPFPTLKSYCDTAAVSTLLLKQGHYPIHSCFKSVFSVSFHCIIHWYCWFFCSRNV